MAERSRAYPVISLEAGVGDLKRIVDNLGRGAHDRDALAEALGYSSSGGLPARKIAALAHYGLLSRQGASYELSDLGDRLLHPKDEQEEMEARAEAFKAPTVFAELVEQYWEDGKVPGQLPNILVRNHGISRKVAAEVGALFLDSGVYANVLNDDGVFTAAVKQKVIEEPEDLVNPGRPKEQPPRSFDNTEPPTSRQPDQRINIALTHGTATIIVPKILTSHDFKKLKLQLAVLELDAVEGGSEV